MSSTDALPEKNDERVTRCLDEVRKRIPGAEDRLMSLVYERLRKMAGYRMRQERPGHTLQATALANEVCVRLIRAAGSMEWRDSNHFYATCARMMRNILIDHARRKKNDGIEVELLPGIALTLQRSEWLVSFDESLDRLSRLDARGAKIIELKAILGLTEAEIAVALDIGERTVKRDLAACRAWLRADMNGRQAAA
jgi:RNA polymerase sigma-70 factor, ECF subfamily